MANKTRNRSKNQNGSTRRSQQGGKPNKQMRSIDSSRRCDRVDEDVASSARISQKNDVAWYTKYAQFAKDAATVAFATPVGNIINIGTSAKTVKYATPGVMRIQFTPTCGVSTDATSPINRSSVMFFSQLRSKQRASGTYDHQDITMMELAIDSCICFHSMLKRVYGLATDVTPVNEYYPRTLIGASGMIYSDVMANMQKLRGYINAFAYNLQQYAIPNNIALFRRHQWMCEGIYTDGEGTRAQTYMFVPQGFWKYDNTVASGSQLTFARWLGDESGSATQYTVDQAIAFGDALLNAISNDEDFATISGDIYNYYNSEMFKLEYVEDTYRIFPVYDKRVLSQIENLTICGSFAGGAVITQNPSVNEGAIIFNPTMHVREGLIYDNLINMHWESPTPEDVIEATRLMAKLRIIDTSDPADIKAQIVLCGTEIVNELDIFARNVGTGGYRAYPYTSQVMFTSRETEIQEYTHFTLLAAFDWAPLILAMDTESGNDYVGLSWDVDNFTKLDDLYLEQINLSVLFSLFATE